MSLFKKKINANPAPNEAEKNEAVEILPTDFTYIQKDERIHDVKFEGKPTTFFADAMKRFLKNKSSVAAAFILLTLITMAIVVPLADRNDIETNVDSSKYLPPKWFGVNDAGFMDGTRKLTDIVCYSETGELSDDTPDSDLVPNGYLKSAIVGDLSVRTVSENNASEFGYGGTVLITPTAHDKNALYTSGVLTWTRDGGYDYDLSYAIDWDLTNEANGSAVSSSFRIIANVETDADPKVSKFVSYPLTDYLDATSPVSLSNITTLLDGKASGAFTESTYPVSFAIELKTSEDTVDAYPSLYIRNFVISASGTEADPTNSITNLGFTSASELLMRGGSSDNATKARAWTGRSGMDIAARGIHRKVASFRYDCYAAAFGDDLYTFPSSQVQDFIDKGYMTYKWTSVTGKETTPGAFELTELGEKYCPIREVISQTHETHFGVELKELNCTRSLYRYDYYKGYIASCEVPYYVFGTDHYGHDFFKLAFSGLLTSLGLGVLASLINITLGLIWGAVSGYFGGWTDMVMERITEILGGMPWIVVMTLIVLFLGSNFWTFLLALCLTGWIGMASETRSQFYRFKGREYVLASRTLGASDARLIFKHILPNGIGTIITSAILSVPSVIFTEANISYLLPGTLAFSGSQSFGITLSNAQADIHYYPYLIVSASIVMILIMISFNLFGNGLRDAFNPSLKGSDE